MFSKKNIKKSNLKDNLKEITIKNFVENEEKDEKEETNLKKRNFNQFYSTSKIAEDYKKTTDEITQDLTFKAKPQLIGNKYNATAENQIDTEFDKDAKAIALRNIKISEQKKSTIKDKKEKVYKGLNGYADFIEKNENAISNAKYTGSLGPIRAPTYLRASCRFDYNPSLCKDWHDTGYCVFGNSCIYIHDRGDYKSGWELEKDYEEEQKKRQKKLEKRMKGEETSSSEDENETELDVDIPKICLICNNKLKNPIVTKCEHFFCESCAISHYRTSKKCFACEKPTQAYLYLYSDDDEDGVEGVLNEEEKKKFLDGVIGYKKGDEPIEKIANDFKKKREKEKVRFVGETDWTM